MEFDLVILGAGSGGYEAGLYAYRRGMKVAFVELSPEAVGGSCLNRGCIPSKYMRHGAYLLEKLRKGENYGILLEDIKVDAQRLAEGRDRVVITIRENFKRFAQKLGIPIFYGRGVLKDEHTVYVEEEGRTIKASYILLATGSSCASLENLRPDGKRIFNTDQIWDLREFPRRMLIVGGGAVGVEFAYIYRMYGVEVILVEIMDRLLPSAYIPEESSRYLARKLKRLGVDVRLKTRLLNYSEGETLKVSLSDGSTVEVDCILLGVGRKPNTDGMGLEYVGVEMDERGFVKVNQHCQTSVKNIYACGDITSSLMLAHKAMYEGKVAVSHMLGDRSWVRDDNLMPKVIYSAYEIASVGLTEDLAEEEGYDYEVGVVSFMSNPKAMDDAEDEGFVRLVVDKDTGKILGCHILGPQAGELLHQVVHLMKANIGVDFLSSAIFSHPSLSESIVQSAMEIHYGPITWIKRK